ncbi:MAG: LacI family transcriptional regulator [Microbacteriaceae bacterium]|jgi:LacI family transcriptional regulator|nr:LacI family transcriptional regulator [Microbacteriaceae bacterium]MDQ1525872.1 LacI family transcriptional regulator [Microbacteriaceae bacterium]
MDKKMQDFTSMTPDSIGEAPEAPSDDAVVQRRIDFHRRATGHPTMAEVAALAGVSLKTVSRVINGEPGVQPDTIERVRRAAQSVGYRRNDAAAALARAEPQATIGLIIEDLSDAFYSHLTRGVQEVAQTNGHLVMLSSSEENSDLERSTTLALAARGVSGMIVVPHSDDHHYLSDVIDAGLSVVFVDRPPVHLTADCVLSDNVEGARQAVEHLARRGHRRIGFIGNDMNVYTSTCRLRGYEVAHAQAGLPVDGSLVILGPRTEAESAQAMHSLLRLPDPPTALFTQNSLLTLGAWRAIRDASAQVALIGFDDFGLAELLDPPVSVVAQDPVGLGRQAAELLFSRLAGEHGDAREIVVPTRLIIRN